MHIKHILRNGLIYTLVVSFCLITTPFKAQAVNFNSFLSFMETLESKVPPGTNLPFSSQQVKSVQDIIGCMESSGNDIDVAICVDQFHDTDLGQQGSAEADIPSWAWDILDAYIMYRTGDYWGLAQELGKAVACIVIEILVGGVDVCGLLEELVQIAQDLWDGAKAIARFIGSVGGAVYDTIKDVGCSLGLGGCDDGPPTPPEVWIYTYIFDAKLGDGLAARKSMDSLAFNDLVARLKANAASKPPVYSTPIPSDPYGMFEKVIGNACADSGAVNRAADIFISAVNTQWTSDIGNNVLPERASRFAQYSNENNALWLTNEALQDFTIGQPWNPKGFLTQKCSNKFINEYQYYHIDRWLNMANTLGQQAQDLKGAVQSNSELCNSFWSLRRNDIAEYVYEYVKTKHCGLLGSTLMCGAVDDYQTCSGLLKPFGDEDKCGINTFVAGKEAVEKVLEEVKKMGTSLPPWKVIAPPVTMGISTKPYTLIGHRPTHVDFCQSIYYNYYRDIPKDLLVCSQRPNAAYTQLVTAVNNAVDEINKTTGYGGGLQVGLFVDPLAVLAATPSLVNELMDSNKTDFGFKPPSKPGFDYSISDYPKSLDGLTTPMIFYDIAGALEQHMKEKVIMTEVNIEDMVDPLGPISDKLTGIDDKTQLKATMADKMNKTTISQTDTISQVSAKSINQHALGGQQHQDGQQQVMSGTLPGSTLPQKPLLPINSKNIITSANSKIAVQLADLQVTNSLKINGQKASWNGMVTLDGSTLKHSTGGRCLVPVHFNIKNGGVTRSPAYQYGWARISAPQMQTALAPGQIKSIDTTFDLPEGTHRLELQLDKLKQVPESDENNNGGVVTVRITGSCSQELKIKSPSSMSIKKPGVIAPMK